MSAPPPPTPTAANIMNPAAATARKTVLITGVSRGLGKALALELAKCGHSVIGCSRTQDNLSSLESELAIASESFKNNKHIVMNVDVRSDSSVEELARSVAEKKVVPDIIGDSTTTAMMGMVSINMEMVFALSSLFLRRNVAFVVDS